MRRELLGMAAYLVAVVAIIGGMYAALGIALTPTDPEPMTPRFEELAPAPEPVTLAKPKTDETFSLSAAPPAPAVATKPAVKPPIKSPPYAKIAKEKALAEMGARKKKRDTTRRAPEETSETLGYAPVRRYGPFSNSTSY